MIRVALGLLVLAAGIPASAHDLGTSPVHPKLGDLPPALGDVIVEVAETLAPQLLIANHGNRVIEILDPAGRAFARVGPDGVEADLNAAAWYQTLSTARPPIPPEARDPAAPPRWTKVASGASFGWFDPRLATGRHAPTEAVRHADQPAVTGTWNIPVRIGGAASAIAGTFVFQPPPDGAYVSTIAPPDGVTGIALRVSQGIVPAVFLANRGPRAVTLLGLDGEPEFRVGPEGVAVNTGSATWQRWGQEVRSTMATPEEHWVTVSHTPAYVWLEPRGRADADGDSHPDKHWTIPIRIDDSEMDLRAVSVWRPSRAESHDD